VSPGFEGHSATVAAKFMQVMDLHDYYVTFAVFIFDYCVIIHAYVMLYA